MSDELDEVHRYVNGIDPPDARTMAEVRGRLSSAMAANSVTSARIGPTRHIHALRWALALFVVLAVGVALIVPSLGHRTPNHGGRAHPQDRLEQLVVDDVSATVASGSYDMRFNDTTTLPTQCAQSAGGGQAVGGPGQKSTVTTVEPCGTENTLPPGISTQSTLSSISGHGTVDTNPYAMVTVSDVGSLGMITLYDNGTNVWEIGGGDYGLSAPGQAGPGAPLSGYASSVEGTVGQVQGALDMEGLASGTGYLDLEAHEIQGAQPAGTGSADGVPVTIYKLSESGLQDPDIGGLTSEQVSTIRAADAIIENSGFAGKTTWISVDSEGYIREQKTQYTLPDGSMVTEDTILSNFGCAGTVLMPGQTGTSSPPAGCVSPDTAGSPARSTTPSTGSLTQTTTPTTVGSSTPTTVVPTPAPVLDRPETLAVAPDGDLLIANQGTNQILRRLPNGALKVVAGTGTAGFSGDGGPAVKAELDTPNGMAVAPNGTIYVADTDNNRVRAIYPSGTMSTVAGDGTGLSPGGGSDQIAVGPFGVGATSARITDPLSVAVGSQGQLYIADSAGIQVVLPNGMLTSLSVTGLSILGIGAPGLLMATAITVDHSGDLYVADFAPKMLIELSPMGAVLHSWGAYVAEGGLATAPDGSIFVADYGFTVDQISNGGLIHVTAFTDNSIPEITGTFRPSGVTVNQSGVIYVDTDGANGGTNTPALGTLSGQGQLQVVATGTNTNPSGT